MNITAQQRTLLRKIHKHAMFINEDVPKPYAYIHTNYEIESVQIRTARSLLSKGLIEKVPTDTIAGSFEYELTALGTKFLGVI